jgi:hypothetical protein
MAIGALACLNSVFFSVRYDLDPSEIESLEKTRTHPSMVNAQRQTLDVCRA